MSVNYNATVNILEGVKNFSQKLRFLSLAQEKNMVRFTKTNYQLIRNLFFRPVNPYAVTKIAQDLIGYVYFKSFGLKVIRTRTFNHEGPRRENVFGIPWYAYQIARIENGLQNQHLR